MWFRWVLLLVLSSSLLIKAEGSGHRTLHRLVGGHLKTDDTELIITSSAGGGRNEKKKGDEGGEEKKTLSQQVADGKYGLIQKELFAKPVKKPGVLSYDVNPDVPKDNINNLGGLNKNDIWLAENHLLVIRGGAFRPHEKNGDGYQSVWGPIDDYKAPSRQVKLPAHPKVPPPFPVQLTDDGPLQILGTNSSTTLNGTFAPAPYPLSPEEGGFYPAFPPGDPYSTNITSGETPFPISPFPPTGEYNPFAPFPLNGSLPPFFASLPPGAAILPPPDNFTEYDEDDPSIYYPPPYSFYYQMDNSTHVPPGPLVPGIVLPPPPNFFAPLEPPPPKKPPRPIHRTTTTESVKQIHPTTTPLPPTRLKPTQINHLLTTPPKIVTVSPVRFSPTNRTYTTTTTIKPYIPERRKKPPSVTVLKPIKSTPRPVYFYENNEVKPYKVYKQQPPPRTPARTGINSPTRTVISSTQIPLKAYYSTSNEIDTNSVTQQPEFYHKPPTTKSPTQYYFYEEQAVTNSITTPRTPKQSDPYFNIPKEYYLPARQASRKPAQQEQYYYRPSRPTNPGRYRFIETTKKPDTFSVHVARLRQQIHEYYTTPDPYRQQHQSYAPTQSTPKPVYQFSFQAANYKPQQENVFRASPIDGVDGNEDRFKPMNKYNVQIQPAIEVHPTQAPIYQSTPSSGYYEKQVSTERPAPSKYYTTPDYDYEEVEIKPKTATPRPIGTSGPIRPNSQYTYEATPSPIYQNYYTKQDDTYYDDITKKYFTVFGKKIPVTSPLPPKQASSTEASPRQHYNSDNSNKNVEIEYAKSVGKEISLEGDTLINYARNRPGPNSQSEYIERPRYQPVSKFVPRYQDDARRYQNDVGQTDANRYQNDQARYQSDGLQYQGESPRYQGDLSRYQSDGARYQSDASRYRTDSSRYQADTSQYQGDSGRYPAQYQREVPQRLQPERHQEPANNNQPEIVEAIPVKVDGQSDRNPGSYISYELPGDDGAHFYFLTPQLAQSRDQGAGFYYSNPNAARIRRNRNS